MKFIYTLLLLLALALPALSAEPKVDFHKTLADATVAVYAGKEVCGYEVKDGGFFGPLDVWGCEFQTHFTCTATVIKNSAPTQYAAITAGHCFDYTVMAKGWDYYIGDEISEHPVLNKLKIVKFDYSDRYDYAIVEFLSLNQYPVIAYDLKGGIPELGTEVLNANFSLGIAKQVEDGKVLSGAINNHIPEQERIQGRYFVRVGIGPGASGSAIVNAQTHQIVGLVEMVFPGTQMATLVMPLGKNFVDFVQDDSAGIKPPAHVGPALKFHVEPPAKPLSTLELLLTLWERFVKELKKI